MKRSPILLLTMLVVGVVGGQYSGTYTIKPSGGDFASHAEAAESLMAYGVTGPCTLLMYTGTYYGQALLDSADWDSVEVVFMTAEGETPEVQHTSYPWCVTYTGRVKLDGIRIISPKVHGAYVYRSERICFCNCDITAGDHGLYIGFSDSCRIVGNRIRAGTGNGVNAPGSGNHMYVAGNDIRAPYSYGLYLYSAAAAESSYYDTIVNNMLYGFAYGACIYLRSFPYVAYNTLMSEHHVALRADRSSDCVWLNNILYCIPSAVDPALAGSGTIALSDHNCFFTSGTWVVIWNNIRYTWPQWQAAGYDPHGMCREPGIGGPLNPHLAAGSPCIDSGMEIPELPLDIDGDDRGSRPDIGADEFTGVGSPMAGTYLIHADPDSGDYDTFNEAISDMVLRGYADDITFDVAGDTYRENILLTGTANGPHTVTFQQRDGAPDAAPVVLRASGSYAVNVISVSRFKFRRLHIIGADYGVHTEGSIDKGCDSLVIAGCRIGAGAYGVYMYNSVDDCSMVGNVIDAGGYTGVVMRGFGSSPEYRCRRNVFANNMVQGWATAGLYLYCHEATSLIFNTVCGDGPYGLHDYQGYDEHLANNIVFGRELGWYREAGLLPSSSDHNCWWSDDSLGRVINDMTLPEWRVHSGLDLHSIAGDPLFISPTDLHIQAGSPCRDAGVVVPGIVLDIDGELRDSTPCIGADEWTEVGVSLPVRTRRDARRPEPSVIRGMLPLPGRQPADLLDIAGRRVMELRPGENDIRGVAPGIYFVRSADSGERSAVTKVVIQK